MIYVLFFFYFSAAILLSSMLTVGLKNPIHCTIALLSALLHTAGLFILLHAEFIAAMQIIIYAGAVLVLYLFVLMLLPLKQAQATVHRPFGFTLFFSIILLAEIVLTLWQSPLFGPGEGTRPGAFPGENNVQALGVALFTDYLLPFEVVGTLLLGGIVGALVLAKQKQSLP